jgi:hypothetical protein
MCYHIKIMLNGLTQWEDSMRFDQRYDDYYVILNRYTAYEKFTSVFGENPLVWFFPISKIYSKNI